MNCILCYLPIRLNWGICSQCFSHIPRTISVCCVCGLPLFFKKQPCHHCSVNKPNWQKFIAVSDYKKPLTKLIHQFKFKQKTEFSYALARLIFLAWYQHRFDFDLTKPDIVTCIPLNKRRFWARGFNQSALLAQHIAHWFHADFQPYLLECHAKKQPQKILSKKQREQNVKHAFDCQSDLTGKTIAIIDDIVTTGYTMNEACKQLKRQGAADIQVLCLCRTTL